MQKLVLHDQQMRVEYLRIALFDGPLHPVLDGLDLGLGLFDGGLETRDLGVDLGRFDRDRVDLEEIRVSRAEDQHAAAADAGGCGESVEEDFLLFNGVRGTLGGRKRICGGGVDHSSKPPSMSAERVSMALSASRPLTSTRRRVPFGAESISMDMTLFPSATCPESRFVTDISDSNSAAA